MKRTASHVGLELPLSKMHKAVPTWAPSLAADIESSIDMWSAEKLRKMMRSVVGLSLQNNHLTLPMLKNITEKHIFRESAIDKCMRILPIDKYFDFQAISSCNLVSKQWKAMSRKVTSLTFSVFKSKKSLATLRSLSKHTLYQRYQLFTLHPMTATQIQKCIAQHSKNLNNITLNLSGIPEKICEETLQCIPPTTTCIALENVKLPIATKYLRTSAHVKDVRVATPGACETIIEFIDTMLHKQFLTKLSYKRVTGVQTTRVLQHGRCPVRTAIFATLPVVDDQKRAFHTNCIELTIENRESFYAVGSGFMHKLTPCTSLRYLSMDAVSSWHPARAKNIFWEMLVDNNNLNHLRLTNIVELVELFDQGDMDAPAAALDVLKNIHTLSFSATCANYARDGDVVLSMVKSMRQIMRLCVSVTTINIDMLFPCNVSSAQVLQVLQPVLEIAQTINITVECVYDDKVQHTTTGKMVAAPVPVIKVDPPVTESINLTVNRGKAANICSALSCIATLEEMSVYTVEKRLMDLSLKTLSFAGNLKRFKCGRLGVSGNIDNIKQLYVRELTIASTLAVSKSSSIEQVFDKNGLVDIKEEANTILKVQAKKNEAKKQVEKKKRAEKQLAQAKLAVEAAKSALAMSAKEVIEIN